MKNITFSQLLASMVLLAALLNIPHLAKSADAPKAPVAPAAVAAPAMVPVPAVAPVAPAAVAAPVVTVDPALADAALKAATPDPEKDLGGFMSMMIDAFKNRNWGVFAGLIIMLLVWVTRKFIPKMKADYLPWVSAAMGIVVSIATDLVAGGTWYFAIFNGLLIGAAASGMWSLVGKHVLVQKPAPEAPKV